MGGKDNCGLVEERVVFWGCKCKDAMLLAATTTHVHVSVFLAALCASGAAVQPELTPLLYGSVNLARACLQLRSPMHAVAGGSGVLGHGLFCPCIAPMHFAVSAHIEPH